MPDKMSQEKILLLRAFGARVVVTPTAVEPDDPRSYYSVARRLVEETPNAILANQYYNPVNPQAHYEMTGPEIWEQTGGRITHLRRRPLPEGAEPRRADRRRRSHWLHPL